MVGWLGRVMGSEWVVGCRVSCCEIFRLCFSLYVFSCLFFRFCIWFLLFSCFFTFEIFLFLFCGCFEKQLKRKTYKNTKKLGVGWVLGWLCWVFLLLLLGGAAFPFSSVGWCCLPLPPLGRGALLPASSGLVLFFLGTAPPKRVGESRWQGKSTTTQRMRRIPPSPRRGRGESTTSPKEEGPPERGGREHHFPQWGMTGRGRGGGEGREQAPPPKRKDRGSRSPEEETGKHHLAEEERSRHLPTPMKEGLGDSSRITGSAAPSAMRAWPRRSFGVAGLGVPWVSRVSPFLWSEMQKDAPLDSHDCAPLNWCFLHLLQVWSS